MKEIDFFREAMKLKEVKRTGWLYKDVPDPESVADHSFGVAILALVVPLPKGVDRNTLVEMALINDIGKVDSEEMVWERGAVLNEEKKKKRMEFLRKRITTIFSLISNKELHALALECLEQKTKTARFLKEIEKLEMVMQALEYEKKVHPSKLDEFWLNAEQYITDTAIKTYFLELKKQRSV